MTLGHPLGDDERQPSASGRQQACGVVDFAQVLKEVLWCLATEGGISYRRIKLSFGLDDDAVEELRDELIGIKRLAADLDGKRLVWAPDGRSARTEVDAAPPPKLPPLRLVERSSPVSPIATCPWAFSPRVRPVGPSAAI